MAEAYTGNSFYHIEGNSDNHGETPFDSLLHHKAVEGETPASSTTDNLSAKETVQLHAGKATVKHNIAGENVDPGTPL